MTRRKSINAAVLLAEEIIDALIGSLTDPAPAASASSVVNADIAPGPQTINPRELNSIYALLAYTAQEQQVLQETVQAIVEAQFGVRHVSAIRASDFGRAVSFIADMRVEQRIN